MSDPDPLARAVDLLAAGAWQEAHEIVQAETSSLAAWLHGIVHTLEGDLGNARHWYRRAGRAFPGADAVQREIAAARALNHPGNGASLRGAPAPRGRPETRMRYGYFTMPLRPPGSESARTMAEDLDQLVVLERLGFEEAWIGEHFTAVWENIPCPDSSLPRRWHAPGRSSSAPASRVCRTTTR